MRVTCYWARMLVRRGSVACFYGLLLLAREPSAEADPVDAGRARVPAVQRSISVPAASVLVHLEAPPGVTLESRTDPTDLWDPRCAAPCDVPVPIALEYRTHGSGRPSRPFQLADAPPGQRVVVHVDPASTGSFVGGIVLTSAGGFAFALGLPLFLIAEACSSNPNSEFNQCGASSRGSEATVAITLAVVGGLALVTGAVLIGENAHSRTRGTIAAFLPRAPSSVSARLGEATWHDSLGDSAPNPPRIFPVPLLSHSF